MNFTLFDIIILAIVTISSITGMYGGILKLIIGLIGFLAAIVVTYFIYPFVQKFLIEFFLLNNEVIIAILASIISYIPSLIMINFLTSRVSMLVGSVSGGIIDRFLGLFAGFISGAIVGIILFLIVSIITSGSYIKAATVNDIFIANIADKYPEWLKKSLTVRYLDNAARNIILLVPEETLKSIKLPSPKETKVNNSMDDLTRTIREKKSSSEPDSHIINEDLERELDDLLAK
jgi:uncharacterized membrane protein required for colicin V production